jgi:O-antigen ligase
MYRVIDLGSTKEKIFGRVILGLWVILLIVNLLYLKSRIASAFYLYETGRAQFDIFLNSLLLFSFISLGFNKQNRQKTFLLIIASLLCIVGIIICFYRTIWLTDILMLPVLFLLGTKSENKQGIKFLLKLLIIVSAIGIILFYISPLFSLLIRNYLNRFQSSSQVTTDPSLVNRYVEWRGVIKGFLSSPIAGIGFGGRYFSYAWVAGFSAFVTYTHNGYLYVLLKTGIIGFIFFSIAYIGLVYQGIRLSRNDFLKPEQRALVRAGTVFLISLLSINITANFLVGRDAMLWAGIVFGYFLVCKKYLTSKEH